MNNDKIKVLFYRYFHNLTSEEENRELAKLLQESTLEPDIRKLMEEAWESFNAEGSAFDPLTSERLLQNIVKEINDEEEDAPLYRPGRNRIWYAAASVAAVLIVVGTYLFQQRPLSDPQAEAPVAAQMLDIDPGTNKAYLTLANGEDIILDNAGLGLLTTEGNTRIIKSDGARLSYEVTHNASGQKPVYHTLRTPRGGQYHLVLPDGTDVWLNAASSIVYPVEFNESSREVRIEGEVFFSVSQLARAGKKVPFTVKTGDLAIEVLGTQFNVNAYRDESSTKTTLLEGAVKIKTKNATRLLTPGQQANVHGTSPDIRISQANTDQAIAWKNGYFHFQQAGIEEIMRQLSKWYDIDVRYEGKIMDKKFSGEIPRNATLLQVLEILEISQIRPRIVDKELIIEAKS